MAAEPGVTLMFSCPVMHSDCFCSKFYHQLTRSSSCKHACGGVCELFHCNEPIRLVDSVILTTS